MVCLPFALLALAAEAPPDPPAAAVATTTEATERPTPSELPPLELARGLRQARIALLEGRTSDGLARLHRLAEEFPHHPLPLLDLWSLHRRHGAAQDEAARLRGLLTQRLSDPAAPLPGFTLHYLASDPGATTEELDLLLDAARRRLTRQPGDVTLLSMVFDVEARLQRAEAARATLIELLALRRDAESLRNLVWIDVHLERWTDVAAHLAELDQLGEVSPWLQSTWIEALAKAGDGEGLLQQLARLEERLSAAERTSGLTDLLLQSAWDLRDAGRAETAERLFRRILELNPGNTEARSATLHLYGGADEIAGHREEIDRRWANEADPHTLLEEGTQRLAAGDAAAAFDLLERASASLPQSDIAAYNLGLAAQQLERWEIALAAYARCTSINPARADGWLNYGASLQRAGRCAQAIPALERALRVDPGLNQAHYYLWACHRELRNPEATLRHMRLYEQSR